MVVDQPILLLGIAVFLPHGENIQGDVSIFVGASVKVCDETSEETSREKVSLTNKYFSWTIRPLQTVEVSRNEMLTHSSMCIDHTNGQKKVKIYDNAVLDRCCTVRYKWIGWDGMVSRWGDV